MSEGTEPAGGSRASVAALAPGDPSVPSACPAARIAARRVRKAWHCHASQRENRPVILCVRGQEISLWLQSKTMLKLLFAAGTSARDPSPDLLPALGRELWCPHLPGAGGQRWPCSREFADWSLIREPWDHFGPSSAVLPIFYPCWSSPGPSVWGKSLGFQSLLGLFLPVGSWCVWSLLRSKGYKQRPRGVPPALPREIPLPMPEHLGFPMP